MHRMAIDSLDKMPGLLIDENQEEVAIADVRPNTSYIHFGTTFNELNPMDVIRIIQVDHDGGVWLESWDYLEDFIEKARALMDPADRAVWDSNRMYS